MKFLHTSDWHLGKTLKGRNRLDEQRAVLGEIIGIARKHEVDAVLVAGDVYDSAAPPAAAQQLAVQALVALRGTGAEVVVIAGNHDHQPTFDAYRPLMSAAGITLVGTPRTAADGGVVTFRAPGTGEPVTVAALPFVSQRYAVRAADLVTQTPDQTAARYDQVVRALMEQLRSGFDDNAVNLVLAHLTVTNGLFGGGERMAQSIFEYHVSAAAFPADAHYVALGHLHRRQTLAAPCPVVYSGAPLAVDFGEQENTNVVCLVEASPGVPAQVTDIALTAGRRLRTVRGTVAELAAQAPELAEDLLRVVVREPARAGLRDEVQELLPNALEVGIDPELRVALGGSRPSAAALARRSPEDLFREFCAAEQFEDPRVEALFARLHDDVSSGD
ncbi:nuclease SbcCD, D subunit [Parafrankia sp. EAN1pec]|uniref:exonuclease SbcCD subunit D n=1 Tax=Parafrankia sp. (strain EAN1pec) TaxID=298653 RepID=UPI00005417F8|nr:nuclease SbcCD, D subunit [Frankia sp. EAN1pec]